MGDGLVQEGIVRWNSVANVLVFKFGVELLGAYFIIMPHNICYR